MLIIGTVSVHFPDKDEVFFNPVQTFNRDISCCVIQQYINDLKSGENGVQSEDGGIRVLDALAASGFFSKKES